MGRTKKLNYRNSDLVYEASVSKKVHKRCDRENGGLTDNTRQGWVTIVAFRERGKRLVDRQQSMEGNQ